VAERRVLSQQERLEEALFMGLRLTSGLDLAAVESRYGVDIWDRYGSELRPFVIAGLAAHEPPRLALTRAGMLLANEIMMVFVGSDRRGPRHTSCV
jgi:oxygen-independent coproporphyrinogen-3 oxidase